MNDFQEILSECLLYSQGVAVITSLLLYKSVKTSYWKYFAWFLLIIFLLECYGKWGIWYLFSKTKFYNYFVIPLEFIFWYWLYAAKSFKNKKLFYFFTTLYIISFIPSELYFKESKIFYSFNYTLGCVLLMFLVFKEYYNQINSSNILSFSKNKMFYINIGVTLFYIGTLPCITFYPILREHQEIWKLYYNYFLISNILMYLLFAASFIWGKQSS
jgi:hypothetical protein